MVRSSKAGLHRFAGVSAILKMLAGVALAVSVVDAKDVLPKGPAIGTVQNAAAPAPLELITAGFWRSTGDNDLQGAALAPDGSVYIVGNGGAPANRLPGGITAKVYGGPQTKPRCGRAFVAHFTGDMSRLLHYAELADGIAIFTTVQVSRQGVYASGYASSALEGLLVDKPGLMTKYPLGEEVRLIEEGKILEANGLKDK